MRALFFICLLAGSTLAWARPHSEILVVHSYSQEYPWTQRQHDGFRRALQAEPALPHVLRVEYLDTKRVVYDAAYGAELASHLARKYAGLQPDAIYVTDDNATSFALSHLVQLFPGVPVFFSGVNDLALGPQLDPERATGVFEQKRIGPGLDLVRRMAGDGDILVAGDASETFELIRDDILAELGETPGVGIDFISSTRLDDLLAQLRGRDERFLFLTTLGALRDAEGRPAALSDAIDTIVAAGDFVVLSMEDVYMRPGVLGGYVTTGTRQGEEAARLLKRHLTGTPLAELPPVFEGLHAYLIDAGELDRRGLALPPDVAGQAMLINRPPTFYDSHRSVIVASLFGLAMALGAVMAGSLLLVLRKNRQLASTSRQLVGQAEDLRAMQESLARAQRIGAMGNWDWNIRDDSLYWSDGIYNLFGLDSRRFAASYPAFVERVHPDDREALEQAVREALHGQTHYDLTHRIVRPGGEVRIVRESGEVMRDDQGQPLRMIGVVQDITEQTRIEQALRDKEQHLTRLAHNDQLTGLPNRIALMDALNTRISDRQQALALMFLDLDRFKPVNDTLGHGVGDRLLQVVAQRLRAAMPPSGQVFRLGGDEFVVLLPGAQQADAVAEAARGLLVQLQQPFSIADHRLHLSASIGIACFPEHGGDAETLLKNADVAMYEAKQEGRNGYQFYRTEMTAQVVHRMQLEGELRDALGQQQLLFHFQPVVAVDSGRIVGAEALLRWVNAEGRMVPPDHFIPLAEETGLILPLGEWVIEEACHTLHRWIAQRRVGADFRLNLNVSGRQLQQPDFPALMAAVLERTGAPARQLVMELTESTVMGASPRIVQALDALRAMGLELAIDDFGTGFSSLAHLKHLPVGEIKIDRSFVSDISRDSNDEAIASAVIALAHNLDLTVVAEGVETEAQEAFLRERGCPLAQGYRYSRPLPEAGFLELLARDLPLPATGAG